VQKFSYRIQLVLTAIFLCLVTTVSAEKNESGREAIGKVLGKTIYRDEINIPEEYRDIEPGFFKKMRPTYIKTDTHENDLMEFVENTDSSDLTFESAEDDDMDSEEDMDSDSDMDSEIDDFAGLDNEMGEENSDDSSSADESEDDYEDEYESAEGGVEELESGESESISGQELFERAWEREKIMQDELLRLFARPLFNDFSQSLADGVKPTKAEVQALADEFSARIAKDKEYHEKKLKKIDALLAQPNLSEAKRKKILDDRELQQELLDLSIEAARGDRTSESYKADERMAEGMIEYWKLNIALYEKHGGGRILWQQAGFEAFDAMRNFLEEQQKQGRFEIFDPALQETLNNYWTEQGHKSFLKDDPKTIAEFLHPVWRGADSRNQKK